MKIIIQGHPYFAQKLAKELSDFDKESKYIFIDSNTKSEWRHFICQIWNSDALYSIGGSTSGSKSILLALLLKKKVIVHWVGTDVLNIKKSLLSYKDKVQHLCEVDWIKNELFAFKINATILDIASISNTSPPPPIPRNAKALCYIGKGREVFYGIDVLYQLASNFPTIEFLVVGISSYPDLPPLKNIKYLGWVNNLPTLIKESFLFLRLPKHDGLAFSVIEALAMGRYVAYTFPFPFCIYAHSYDELYKQVKQLVALNEKGTLDLNTAGSNYVTENFQHNKVLSNLRAFIKSVIDNK